MFIRFNREVSRRKRDVFLFVAVVAVVFLVSGFFIGNVFETYTNGSTL